MRGSDFAELKAFAAVAEAASFSRAARRLGVSPSALSQTLRGLEGRLGVRLLNRTTRSVTPTEAGERLLDRLRPLFAEFDQAVEEVNRFRDAPAGRLRINVPRLAAALFVGPVLGRFHHAHPGVELEVVVDDTITDIVAGRFDAGIRLGETLERDMVAVPLTGALELAAVATPDYFAEHGVPKTPADLHRHRCLRFRWPGGGDLYRWEFEKGGQEVSLAVDGPLVVNDTALMLQAAFGGAGIAYLLDCQAQADVEAGRLQRVLRDWSPRFPGFYLYHPGRRQMPPALRAFIEVLRAGPGSPG
ncbi:LysR family transcriptional regulator [Inquilinus sp. Marseille-Q2685]|uniref:LysR family transcriptional regulator n=1 Tax=Inquilinus sp. Marseille-Q2685 TaxID=2866581 RepID=UPI001CE44BD9|nr:LysR family transcriptional regulator [Inquilinus sp. Marseille-Q2685]